MGALAACWELEWPPVFAAAVASIIEDGVVVTALARVDDEEHGRRTRAETIETLSLRQLAALWELPEGHPIDDRALSRRTTDVLRRLPPEIVEHSDGAWIRHARAPLRIVGVAADAVRWRPAAQALGSFVTVARRAVVAGGAVPDEPRAEAALWGIGVVQRPDRVLLVAEAPVVELGPFQWWLAERVYAAWQTAATGSPMHAPAG